MGGGVSKRHYLPVLSGKSNEHVHLLMLAHILLKLRNLLRCLLNFCAHCTVPSDDLLLAKFRLFGGSCWRLRTALLFRRHRLKAYLPLTGSGRGETYM